MAIYGAGSKFGGETEMKDIFFKEELFRLGWDYENARDLYSAISLLKVGDIIYLKANAPGSFSIRVKGIGVVTQSFVHCLVEDGLSANDITEWDSLYVKVHWIIKEEFHIDIPNNDGKLTAVRAASFYEEYLPFVQNSIIDKMFSK